MARGGEWAYFDSAMAPAKSQTPLSPFAPVQCGEPWLRELVDPSGDTRNDSAGQVVP
jgi:hypothetical protein